MELQQLFGRRGWIVLAAPAVISMNRARAQGAGVAATPPMGWNSWDAYGESVKESDIRLSAEWMAKNLLAYGWEYIVVDSGWYVTNHSAGFNAENAEFSLDGSGRYTPAVNTIPSATNGAGFQPLADYLHSRGLKFGLHILRGIPKEAVAKNLPMQGSEFHARDAADRTDTCPWNSFNYGLDTTKPAAQAYYDSLARQFAEWHVDYVKIDCISSRPYKGEEIRLISQALKKTARPMVLCLSPGAAPVEKADEMASYAEMWRISDDEWDVWQSSEDFLSTGRTRMCWPLGDWSRHRDGARASNAADKRRAAQNHAVVFVEDLQVQSMSRSSKGTKAKPGKRVAQKSGLNRSILDASPFELRRQLAYKTRWNGGVLLPVAPQNSSRKCPECRTGSLP